MPRRPDPFAPSGRLRRRLIVGATALAVAALFTVPGWLARHRGVGEAAPAFTAAVVAPGPGLPAARERAAADYRGQVTLLDFWNLNCANCPPGLRELEGLHRELGPRGLRVVAVSLDPAGDAGRVREAARSLGLTYEVLQDAGGASARAYQVFGVPTSVLVDRAGVVRHRVIGTLPDADGAHASEWTTPAGRAVLERALAAR